MGIRTRGSDERIDDLKGSVDRIDSRIDSLHRTMIVGFISLATMMVGGFGVIIALFATHF